MIEKPKALKLKKAAEKVQESVAETLTYYRFPPEHHRQIRTNNMLERVVRELLDEVDPKQHSGGLKKVLTPEGHWL